MISAEDLVMSLNGASIDQALDYAAEQSRGNSQIPARIGDLSFEVGNSVEEDRLVVSPSEEGKTAVRTAIGPVALKQICADVKVPYNFFCMNQSDLRDVMMKRWIANNAKKKRILQMANRYVKITLNNESLERKDLAKAMKEKKEGAVSFTLIEEPCMRAVLSPSHNFVTNLQFLQELKKTDKDGVEWKATGGNNLLDQRFDVVTMRQIKDLVVIDKLSKNYAAVYFTFSEMGWPLTADTGLYRGSCTNQLRTRSQGFRVPDYRKSYSKILSEAEIPLVRSLSLNVIQDFEKKKGTLTALGAQPMKPEEAVQQLEEMADYRQLSSRVAKDLTNKILGNVTENGQTFKVENKFDFASCLSAEARTKTGTNKDSLEALAGYLLLVSPN